MERHDGDLEAEAGDDQNRADDPRNRTRAGTERADDRGQIERTGGAEKEGEPQDQEGAGEAPQEKILERRLARLLAVAAQAGERVAGDRQHLEAQEHDQKILSRGHDHHARQGEEEKGEDLAVVHVLLLDVLERKQADERHGAAEEDGEIDGQTVEIERPVKIRTALSPRADGQGRAREEKSDGRQTERSLVAAREEDVEKENGHGPRHDGRERRYGPEAGHGSEASRLFCPPTGPTGIGRPFPGPASACPIPAAILGTGRSCRT